MKNNPEKMRGVSCVLVQLQKAQNQKKNTRNVLEGFITWLTYSESTKSEKKKKIHECFRNVLYFETFITWLHYA